MIELSVLLKLQFLYCFLGIGYNAVSYIQLRRGRRQLSANSPIGGAGFMMLYGLLLIVGYTGFQAAYRVIMGLCLVVFGYGGVVRHIVRYPRHPEDYSSTTAWLSAIAVNLFGVLLNFLAVSGQYNLSD